MIIFTVIVTHNRWKLLQRALESIVIQTRKPNFVVIVSNSIDKNQLIEQRLCNQYGFEWIINSRTKNYAGALNTGIQHYIEENKVTKNVYFSSLDDDDIWDPNYLEILETESENRDVVLANIIRNSTKEKNKLELPSALDYYSFLATNPGIGGSNTFVRLQTLLKAGAFDELMSATVDRDVFVRLFLLHPTYKVINKHLVTLFVERNRERVTTNRSLKIESYRYFFYKYRYLMRIADREKFFLRAKAVFNITKSEVVKSYTKEVIIKQQEITFEDKIQFQFIIGFIAGDKIIAERIIKSIISKRISISKLVVIDNLAASEDFKDTKRLLKDYGINFTIVDKNEWGANLPKGHYGEYFKKYTKINSIPIGRTILQHHLYIESIPFERPVFWVIDDDVTFTNTIYNNLHDESIDLFKIINQNIDKWDVLIGSVSKDPPLPFLSSIRGQLIDLYYSSLAPIKENADYANLYLQQDYYYDITDVSSSHIEAPIYYHSSVEEDAKFIFSGKSVSRPCLQRKIIGEEKLVTNRGPNTLVFNRDVLRFYPVVNMEVNEKFVRRGDLLWALLNQLISKRKIVEHSFCIDQNRPFVKFDIERELDKSANDIIGYAFNKAIIKTINLINEETNPNRPKDIYEALNKTEYFQHFMFTYNHFLVKRKSRFLMNYYRIYGLIKLLVLKNDSLTEYLDQFTDENLDCFFLKTLTLSKKETAIKQFLGNLSSAIWTYEASIKNQLETKELHMARIMNVFNVQSKLHLLGTGTEGIVFTDKTFVYKSFFSIKDNEWSFLKKKSNVFHNCLLLEKLDFLERDSCFYIKYTYHEYKKVDRVPKSQLVDFLRFCKEHKFVFSNVKPVNFILTEQNQLKLIDYGRSFEPYTEDKFINMTKRAYLMLRNPEIAESQFKKLTSKINNGEIPREILEWEELLKEVI